MGVTRGCYCWILTPGNSRAMRFVVSPLDLFAWLSEDMPEAREEGDVVLVLVLWGGKLASLNDRTTGFLGALELGALEYFELSSSDSGACLLFPVIE